VRQFYFIGKDNIFFHTSMWPAELMGMGERFMEIFAGEQGIKLSLPYDVPANQFMNLEGKKISGSRNWAVWGRDFLTRYDPDALRYYLTVNMPENKDSDWDWQEFVARNNNELVATWGNLANRVLSFCYKNWNGHVPDFGLVRTIDAVSRPVDTKLLDVISKGFEVVGTELDAVRLRSALSEAMKLATSVNVYLDVNSPWSVIKTDKDSAARTIYTSLKAIDSLKVIFAPFLPFTSERLHRFLGYESTLFGEQYTDTVHDSLGEHTILRYKRIEGLQWKPSDLEPGKKLNQPGPLYKKLEESVAEAERARLGI
jgi:methionyl-tRNA synthetase